MICVSLEHQTVSLAASVRIKGNTNNPRQISVDGKLEVKLNRITLGKKEKSEHISGKSQKKKARNECEHVER